jgi:ketosteroid isomerase-like protein
VFGEARRAEVARYLPIAEHGLIGDLRTVALVGTDGTIDWYCCPRFDSPSVFAARDTARAMSQENVEWVRRSHDHFGRTGEPFLEAMDPAVEVYDHDIPDASNPYRGFDGVDRWLSDFAESWDRYELQIERILDGGDQVVSLFRINAVGASSGVAVERGDAMVWTFRDGRVTRIDYFNDQHEALEAAGLSE